MTMTDKANLLTALELGLSVRTFGTDNGDTWKADLRDLLHDCVDSAPAEQADRIREAQSLLRQGAELMGLPSRGLPDIKVTEAMLSLEAHESAVLAIMGGESAFMLSRGPNGNCLASVVLPDGSEEMVAQASTVALALLAAYLSSLITDGEQVLAGADANSASAGARLN